MVAQMVKCYSSQPMQCLETADSHKKNIANDLLYMEFQTYKLHLEENNIKKKLWEETTNCFCPSRPLDQMRPKGEIRPQKTRLMTGGAGKED
jgi:hypothetical protein